MQFVLVIDSERFGTNGDTNALRHKPPPLHDMQGPHHDAPWIFSVNGYSATVELTREKFRDSNCQRFVGEFNHGRPSQ